MAIDIAADLDEQLVECRTTLQKQARDMLTTLIQFEEKFKARLDAAEARLAALRAETEGLASRTNKETTCDD